jgi:coiled-coil domain-containing protein 12
MSSTHASLDAAATDRKARLAKLASLKRKQPSTDPSDEQSSLNGNVDEISSDVAATYISGRNYDPETRGPKLGFEQAPTEGQVTLEAKAAEIAKAAAEEAKEDVEADRPIDLFKLQPKKPNWDLKRDLNEKMKILDVRTENAIARLVRQRIENAQKAAKEKGSAGKELDGEEVGIDGGTLVGGVHVREREEAEDERREREDEELS